MICLNVLLFCFVFCFVAVCFFSTPATLDQNYVVCELQQKVNMLYSFLRTHLKKKSIVFFASCKEVWFFNPSFHPRILKVTKWRYPYSCQGIGVVRLWSNLQQEIGGTNHHLLLHVIHGLALRQFSVPGSMQEGSGDLSVLSHFCGLLLKMNAKS